MTYEEHITAQRDAYLRDVMARAGGNASKAAKLAGLNVSTLHKMLIRAKLVQPRRVYGSKEWQELRS